jgi:hypothetical protein
MDNSDLEQQQQDTPICQAHIDCNVEQQLDHTSAKDKAMLAYLAASCNIFNEIDIQNV